MYPEPTKLQSPLDPYDTGDLYKFGGRIRRKVVLWATHLGDDILADAGTSVVAIGEGQVVWSQMRLGQLQHRNWGGVVIIGHTNPTDHSLFFSVYGHLKEPLVQTGDIVSQGQQIGSVAPADTPENGWWHTPHLHFAIYTGPWHEQILPGWARPEYRFLRGSSRKTNMKWWHDPRQFIEQYTSF
jgi:murein DD-endopeptidase MepM/ murein hydrolase activator NlpD